MYWEYFDYLIIFFRNMEILDESNVSKNPIAIEEGGTDVIMNQQYIENSIQHLEIVPVDESVDELQYDNIF